MEEADMEEWICQLNIVRFFRLLARAPGDAQRTTLLTLLAREQAKLAQLTMGPKVEGAESPDIGASTLDVAQREDRLPALYLTEERRICAPKRTNALVRRYRAAAHH